MAKVTADTLAAEVEKLLNEYKEDVEIEVSDICEAAGKKGAQALKNDSLAKFKRHGDGKRYGSGWTVTVERDRMKTTATIHNKTHYQLAHLLENGHAKRGGGRVPAYPHIAPVEQEIIQTVEREIAKL